MQTLKNVVTGLCSMALVLAPAAAPLARVVAGEPWEIVPEDSLRDLRGGMDLGDLVASFAIERVVEIDGVVVARMQLVISNLDRLAKGGMPTITVTGPMAEIVQFMKTAGNVSFAGTNVSVPSSAASLPAGSVSPLTGPSAPVPSGAGASAARSTTAAGAGAAASAAASAGPTVASSGNSGSVSATGTQSGSMAQFGSGLTNAVTAATNATSQPSAPTSGATGTASPSTASSLANTAGGAANAPTSSLANAASNAANAPASNSANTAGSAANAPATAASNTHLQASATSPVSAQPASSSAVPADTTRTIPVGTTGQVVVLSNLPNATALTTAVQNEVHAATIQTQTTISAVLNSIPALNAISMANSIRAQVSGGG